MESQFKHDAIAIAQAELAAQIDAHLDAQSEYERLLADLERYKFGTPLYNYKHIAKMCGLSYHNLVSSMTGKRRWTLPALRRVHAEMSAICNVDNNSAKLHAEIATLRESVEKLNVLLKRKIKRREYNERRRVGG